MSTIEARYQDELDRAPASPGLTRFLAFDANGFRVVRSLGEPGNVSGWHHHGDYDVYRFVASGHARFEKKDQAADAIEVGPGDFFHVPPHTVHREINPSSEEGQEVILFLKGSGPLVTNVQGPEGGWTHLEIAGTRCLSDRKTARDLNAADPGDPNKF